jgi:hypothetical protein
MSDSQFAFMASVLLSQQSVSKAFFDKSNDTYGNGADLKSIMNVSTLVYSLAWAS